MSQPTVRPRGPIWLPAIAITGGALAVGLGAIASDEAPDKIDGYTLGEQVACRPDREVEAGAGITCEQLIECARADLWEADAPPIDRAGVYGLPPNSPNDAGGWIVVFELTDGGRRATNVNLIPQCLGHASSTQPSAR